MVSFHRDARQKELCKQFFPCIGRAVHTTLNSAAAISSAPHANDRRAGGARGTVARLTFSAGHRRCTD